MASILLVPLAAGLCFLLAALACARGWRIGPWLGAAGVAILAGALAARGLRAEHWPLTTAYEFALTFSLCTALAALALGILAPHPEPDRSEPTLSSSGSLTVDSVEGPALNKPEGPRRSVAGTAAVQSVAMLLAAAFVAYARLGIPAFKRAIQPLPPALDSVWLPLHVASAALAYGTLALGGAAALVWLVHRPSRAEAQWLQDRAIAAGYPLLTLSLILGMIWAQVAWGRYWGWDLKEVWTLITWLVYTLYWHLRGQTRWRGCRLAWLALAGLCSVLFTFLGVGWLARTVGLQSLHLF